MKRLLCIAVVLFSFGAHAQSRSAVDWIFLVDTSRSMRPIFEEVQGSIRTFVSQARDGDSVTVLTFDRDVQLQSAQRIDATSRGQLEAKIAGLQANGKRTHLGLAIARGLEVAALAPPNRVRAVVLFTDGKEDVSGIPNPVPILDNVRQVGNSHVFFVSMGEHEPQLDEFVRNAPRSKVLLVPRPEEIRDVANQIREVIDPKPPPPPPLRVELSPTTIAFGIVTRGETSPERTLTIRSNRDVRIRLDVDAPGGVTVTPLGEIAIAKDRPATVNLRVIVDEDAPPGAKELTIGAGAVQATATVDVVEPPLAVRIAKIAIPIAILIAIALALLASHRRKNRLEGELEILEPRLASDAAYVGLPQLRATEVALSAIVPRDVLSGHDARLFVRRRNGKKNVWIASQGGQLRVNDVETPMSELFDADTIRIGDAKLRFNRAGHERTAETGEES
jgi:von Willebrand factor type A domain